MNSKSEKSVSPERVEVLFDCYGANPDAWPEEEREMAVRLIKNSSELQARQREAEHLDQYLASGDNRPVNAEPVDSRLVARIVNHLPQQNKPESVATFPVREKRAKSSMFDVSNWIGGNWIGMAAASIAVVVISISIVNLEFSSTPQPEPRLVQVELDEWMWEQVTGETNSEEDEPVTFMTLL